MEEKSQLNIMEYYDWVAEQKFAGPQEHHKFVPIEEQELLQEFAYPMFYERGESEKFKTHYPFPLVLKDYSTRYPKYVIDNNHFTIVFFLYDNQDSESCWEVSFHIKDHDFCDKRIKKLKSWLSGTIYAEMAGMPKEFLYPKINIHDEKAEDFCIEFWNVARNYMLLRFLEFFKF